MAAKTRLQDNSGEAMQHFKLDMRAWANWLR